MKQIFKRFVILFLITILSLNFIMSDDGDFDFNFDFDNYSNINQKLGVSQSEPIKSGIIDISPSEEDALAVIADHVSGPIWNRTVSPEGRDPLYLMAGSFKNFDKRNFQMNLFYNHTNHMGVVAGDFLGLTFANSAAESKFFREIAQAIKDKKGTDATGEDLNILLTMLRNLWVQERKSGFLFKINFLEEPFLLQLDLPLVMVERNLFTSNKDKKLITDLVKKNIGTSPNSLDEKREFARMRIGIGDIKLKLGLKVLDYENFKLSLGLAGIIPTAWGILLDGKFRKPKEVAFGDYDFFAALTDNARDMVLYPDLGNNGHFGIGPFLDLKYSLLDKSLNLWGKFLFDSLLPAKEKRLIMSKKTIENPISIFQMNDSDEKTELMDEFKSQYLSPKEYSVTTHPGGVFEVTLGADWTHKRWTIGGWYDFYLQQREVFEKLHHTDVNMNSLKVSEAIVDRASQHKLGAEVSYKIKIKKSSMDIGVGGDLTLISRTMGKDWTAYGKLGFNF